LFGVADVKRALAPRRRTRHRPGRPDRGRRRCPSIAAGSVHLPARQCADPTNIVAPVAHPCGVPWPASIASGPPRLFLGNTTSALQRGLHRGNEPVVCRRQGEAGNMVLPLWAALGLRTWPTRSGAGCREAAVGKPHAAAGVQSSRAGRAVGRDRPHKSECLTRTMPWLHPQAGVRGAAAPPHGCEAGRRCVLKTAMAFAPASDVRNHAAGFFAVAVTTGT
jgi:hypothetical protein